MHIIIIIIFFIIVCVCVRVLLFITRCPKRHGQRGSAVNKQGAVWSSVSVC